MSGIHGIFLYSRSTIPVDKKPKHPIEIRPQVQEQPFGWSRQQAFAFIARISPDFAFRRKVSKEGLMFKLVKVSEPGEVVLTVQCSRHATDFRFTLYKFDSQLIANFVQTDKPVLIPRRGTYWGLSLSDADEEMPFQNLGFIGNYVKRFLYFDDKMDVLMELGERAFTKRTLQKWSAVSEGSTDFESIIDGLDGVRDVFYSVREEKDQNSFTWAHEGAAATLEALVWIPTCAISVIREFSYYQLDASFYVFHPYVYVVPTFIVHNTGFPLGIIIGRSENSELYGHLLTGVRKLDDFYHLQGELVERFLSLPCLSDKGTGLKKFCEDNKIKQFHCHRHIIEEFGSSSIYGLISRLILQTESWDQFLTEVQRCNMMFYTLIAQGNCSQTALNKYCSLTCQEYIVTANVGAFYWPRVRTAQGLREHVEKAISTWAIWMRGDVANTTNIQESFHGKMNWVIKKKSKKGHRCFCRNLRLMVAQINKRRKGFGVKVVRNLKDSFAKYHGSVKLLKDKTLQVERAEAGHYCRECTVGVRMGRKWNTSTSFPCKHASHATAVKMFQNFQEEVSRKIATVKGNILDQPPRMAASYSRVDPVTAGTSKQKRLKVAKGTEISCSSCLSPHEKAIAKLANLIWATLGDRATSQHEISLMVSTALPPGSIQNEPTAHQIIATYNTIQSRLPKRRT